MTAPRAVQAAAGLLLDRAFGEPPSAVHPVVHFAHVMDAFEEGSYSDAKVPGALYAAVGTMLGLGAGKVLRSTALATGLSVGGRALHRAARDVEAPLLAGNLDEARAKLPSLVGRDPSQLDETGIARAVIESVAENTVDAIVAPALWAAALGATGALGYRAVNTMDAMVGHRSPRYEKYGTASARLDDVANWIPARCTAALVCCVRPRSAPRIREAVRTQAPTHPSPNSGVAEAAFAAALGIRLGGPSSYGERFEERPQLGRGRAAQANDIDGAIALSRNVTTALGGLLAVVGCTQWWRRR